MLILVSCGAEKKKLDEGKLHYEIDYPELKEQFFIYQILPKNLNVSFKKSKMKMAITKAGIDNIVFLDNKNKTMTLYFKGDKAIYTKLRDGVKSTYFKDQDVLEIILTEQKDTLAGLDILLAKGINKAGDTLDIWYTKEIDISNANWNNPFRNLPGIPVKYTVRQFGVLMELKLKTFKREKISDKEITFKPIGKEVSYQEYKSSISNLFNSFK